MAMRSMWEIMEAAILSRVGGTPKGTPSYGEETHYVERLVRCQGCDGRRDLPTCASCKGRGMVPARVPE